MEWWVIAEASSDNPRGSFIVVQGNALQIRAKYGSAARGPYPTQAAAQAAANSRGGGFPGPNISGNPGTAIKQGIGAALDPFHGLNLGNIFLRIGEVLLGIVLIGVGVAKLTGTTNFVASAIKAKI
jgi:hypothetical protein